MRQKLFLSLVFCLLSNSACSSFDKKPVAADADSPTVSSSVKPSETVSSPPATEAAPTAEEKNLLSLASGAILLKHPPSFGFWSVKLVDGSDDFWISPGGKGQNQVFVVAMPAETVFKSFSFTKGDDYYGEGSSAKDILVEVSNNDAKSGYQKVLETSLPIDVEAKQKFPVTAELPARFVRLTVKNSHKNPENVSIAEFRGYGTQKPEKLPEGLSGVYHPLNHIGDTDTTVSNEGEYRFLTEAEAKQERSDYSISLKQEGTQIFGCIGAGDNYFSGGIEGNVAQTSWINNLDEKPKKGVMSFSPDGKYMAYFQLNEENGFEDYKVYQKIDNAPAPCAAVKGFGEGDTAKNQIAEDLSDDGRAVIYGINFDFNSDKLRDESKLVLNKIAAILKENADWKMKIEGHTDNIGGENYNAALSEKRAAAVKNYLVGAGIDAARLSSKGLGLSVPIAPNENEVGRAKNRRVELVKE